MQEKFHMAISEKDLKDASSFISLQVRRALEYLQNRNDCDVDLLELDRQISDDVHDAFDFTVRKALGLENRRMIK